MPFVSKAEQRKWDELLSTKVITKEQYERKLAGTPSELPERGAKVPPVAVIRRPKRVHKG